MLKNNIRSERTVFSVSKIYLGNTLKRRGKLTRLVCLAAICNIILRNYTEYTVVVYRNGTIVNFAETLYGKPDKNKHVLIITSLGYTGK